MLETVEMLFPASCKSSDESHQVGSTQTKGTPRDFSSMGVLPLTSTLQIPQKYKILTGNASLKLSTLYFPPKK